MAHIYQDGFSSRRDGRVNAEFVLRAVNNHERLLSALKGLVDALDDAGESKDGRGNDYASVAEARAALAAAKGGGK